MQKRVRRENTPIALSQEIRYNANNIRFRYTIVFTYKQ